MTLQRVNWNRQIIKDVNPALKRFERWLNEHGYRYACINLYLRPIERLLKEMGSSNPTLEDAKLWHVDLAESKAGVQHGEYLGRGIESILRSRGMELTLPYMKVSNKIPYFLAKKRS